MTASVADSDVTLFWSRSYRYPRVCVELHQGDRDEHKDAQADEN